MESDMDRQFFVYLPASVEVNGFMQFLMCQLSERIKEMMLKLGKMSSALVLGCLLCVALCSTGAFAQSASYNAAQGVTTHAWQGASAVAKNEKTARPNSWGNGWHGRRSGRFSRMIRVTRMMRVTQLIRVTRIRVIRETRMIRVTRFIRETQSRRVGGCGGGC